MNFWEVVRNRYSCKKFSDRIVEKEKLKHILEAGRLAPTAKNLQEHHIYVLQSEEFLAKIDKVTPCDTGLKPYFLSPLIKRMCLSIPEQKEIPGWKMQVLWQLIVC